MWWRGKGRHRLVQFSIGYGKYVSYGQRYMAQNGHLYKNTYDQGTVLVA